MGLHLEVCRHCVEGSWLLIRNRFLDIGFTTPNPDAKTQALNPEPCSGAEASRPSNGAPKASV